MYCHGLAIIIPDFFHELVSQSLFLAHMMRHRFFEARWALQKRKTNTYSPDKHCLHHILLPHTVRVWQVWAVY